MENPALLDTQETTARFTPPDTYRAFTDDSDPQEQAQVRLVYSILDGSGYTKHVDALDSCRSQAWFIRHDESGIVRIATNKCNVRFCPFCSKRRQAFLTGQVSEWFQDAKHPKMLTVTLKHSEAPLAWQIKILYDAFRKFRQRLYLKKRITGGVWFFQIKKSKSDGLWHPHVHALVDGDFLDQGKLSELWQAITLTSKIVDIRSVKDPDQAVRHTARYAARPSALKDLSVPEACELVASLQGKRLCGTWGNARVISLRPKKPEDADSWKNIGSWSFVSHMYESSEDARRIFFAFSSGEPLEATVSLSKLEANVLEGFDFDAIPPPKEYEPTFFD